MSEKHAARIETARAKLAKRRRVYEAQRAQILSLNGRLAVVERELAEERKHAKLREDELSETYAQLQRRTSSEGVRHAPQCVQDNRPTVRSLPCPLTLTLATAGIDKACVGGRVAAGSHDQARGRAAAAA